MTDEQKLYSYVKEACQLSTDAREILNNHSDLTSEIKDDICLMNAYYGRLQFINMFKEKLGVKKALANAKYIFLDIKDISNKIKRYMKTTTV